MASNWQDFVTNVKLNTADAEDKLKKLAQEQKKLTEEMNKLTSSGGSKKQVNNLQKQINQNERAMRQLEKQATNVIDVIDNMDSSSLVQLQQAQKMLNAEMRKTPQNTQYYKDLTERLQKVNTAIAGIKETTKQNYAEMKGLADETSNLNQVLKNLNTSSLKELSQAEATLKRQMQEAKPDTDPYKQAASNLKVVQNRIADINRAQKEVNTAIDRYNEELKNCTKSAEKVKDENKLIKQTLDNLNRTSIREMEASVQVLNERLRGTERGTAEYRQLEAQLRRVKTQLTAVGNEQQAVTSRWQRFMNMLNKNWGAFTQIIGTFSGLTLTIRKCVGDFAEMDEAMTNVMKYTGQTKEEVKAMNEDFKRIDTRTSREQLNELAGAAGRLGITSKKDIEEFVDAADKINVALGDDLGEGAVDQIGKLAMAFGEDDKMGLRGAMLATGSALNELAQNSSANAGYLVDFTARVAGVGKQLGLTQAQIMGFGAVMDENMQRDEMASTAFSQLLTKMATDTDKFAKMAGKSTKEFAQMMKTDVNGAVIALMENLRKSGGFSELANIFNEMQLDGTRCVQVLSTMADKVDDIKTRQQVATQAYAQGTSVLNEFNTANNNAQAELDKAKKKFMELSIELGEKLLPVARYGITTTSLLVRGLSMLVDFVSKYRGTLIRLAATITIVTALMNLNNIAFKVHYRYLVLAEKAEKIYRAVMLTTRSALVAVHAIWVLLTKGVKEYIVVMRAAKIASMTNPWTALATVLLTVGVAVYELISKLKGESEEAEKAALATNKFYQIQKNTKEVNEEANKTVAEQITRLNTLRKTLEDNNAKMEERRKALYQIKQMVPEYHGALTKEGRLINSNVLVLQQYVSNLIQAARAQAAFNKMVTIQENSLNHESLKNGRVRNQQYFLNKMINEYGYDPRKGKIGYLVGKGNYVLDENNSRVGDYLSSDQMKILEHYIEMYNWNQKRIDQENKILEVNKAQTDELNRQVKASGGIPTDNGAGGAPSSNAGGTKNSGGGYTPTGKDASKKAKAAEAARKKREKAREKAFKAEVKAEKDHTAEMQAQLITEYSTGNKLYGDYMDARHQTAIEGLEKIKKVYQKYGKDTGEIEKHIAEEQKAMQDDEQKSSIKELERDKAKQEADARLQFYNDPASKIYQNEEALNERLFEIDYEAQKEKVKILTMGTEEWFDAQDQLAEMQREHKLSLEQNFAEKLKRYKEQWGRTDIEQQKQIVLKGLDDLLNKKLIKEEEYQEMRRQIELQYELQKSEEAKNNSHNEVVKRNAHTAYQTASNNADANEGEKKPTLGNYLLGDITHYKDTVANLKKMYGEDAENFEEFQQAKSEAFGIMMGGITAKAQAAYDSISQILDGMSSYYDAQSQYEQNVVTKKYEKQINAAGNNSAKKKKLEEKEQKEIAKIKTKYNKKAMKIELAKATAQMILGAMSAYTSAFEGAPWPSNLVLAPIAAGIAMAAGLLNIATIKKQHAAEEAGYYSGGFTGGTNYRRTAGVVHEGEFVANHQALANPNVMPVLQLIDQAQRTNTVGSLTANDVTRQLGQGGSAVVAPVVNVSNDNTAVAETMDGVNQSVDRLNRTIENGIPAVIYLDGNDGLMHRIKEYKRLQENK
jgi:TP901 family phage tail tape measure protein